MTPRKRYEADVPSIPCQVLIELRILTPHLPFLLQGFVPSWRHVFDMGHTDRSFAVHGPGQSGMAPLRAVLVFRTISPSCVLWSPHQVSWAAPTTMTWCSGTWKRISTRFSCFRATNSPRERECQASPDCSRETGQNNSLHEISSKSRVDAKTKKQRKQRKMTISVNFLNFWTMTDLEF